MMLQAGCLGFGDTADVDDAIESTGYGLAYGRGPYGSVGGDSHV